MPSRRRSDRGARGPPGFQVARALPVGRHPLLEAFPGLGSLETAARLEPDPTKRTELFARTVVEIVPDDVWMYIAPHTLPKTVPRRWQPHLAPDADCIVVGLDHLRESPPMVLFLDIYHELCHIRQRAAGEELFDRPEEYVRRPTEVSAYRFVVDEARRWGSTEEFLREYLEVEWVSEEDLRELYRAVGIGPARSAR